MRFLSILAAVMALPALAASAQSLKPDEVLSSVTVQPVSEPNPVLGADGRIHLAYELVVTNPTRLLVELDKVEAVDGSGKTLASLDGDALAATVLLYGGSGRMLSPGGTAIVFMDVPLPASAGLPDRIAARISAFRQSVGTDGKPIPLAADTPLPAHYTFTGGATAIGKPAVAVAPPLRGSGWIAFNGCCDALTSHRSAVMAVNGQLRMPERFAIDWVKLGTGTRLFNGAGTKLEDYAYYGTPVHAVADGVVVNLYDDADEQAPNQPVKGITPENIGGNMLVIDIHIPEVRTLWQEGDRRCMFRLRQAMPRPPPSGTAPQ